MREVNFLVEYPGTYGGRASRDEVLRALKEALALVENCATDAELVCAGLRIELLDEGMRSATNRQPDRS